MQNAIKHFLEIRCKNKTLKNIAKDCLANIRLLYFIHLNKIDNFYNEIKNKYRVKFPKFFKYFDNNYIKENSIYSIIWNYIEYISNNTNNDIMIYTNNIYESINRSLNSIFFWLLQNFLQFQK